MDKSDETDSRTWDQEEAGKESEKKRRSRDFLRGLITGMLIISLLFACVCTGGVLYRLYKARAVGVSAQGGRESVVTNDTFEKMKVIEDAVSTYYYYEDKVDAEEMREGIYKGMIDSLGDPYSEYYSKEELEEAINSNQGISYGIGAYISMSKQMNMAMINGVMEGSPAEEAGLREGDIIYEVDGEATQGMSLTQVVSLVKGREGTTVQLTIYREGEVDFQRLEINISQTTSLILSRGMYEADEGDVWLYEDEMLRGLYEVLFEAVDREQQRYAYEKKGLWMWKDIVGGIGRAGKTCIPVGELYYRENYPEIYESGEFNDVWNRSLQTVGVKLLQAHFVRFLYHTLMLLPQAFICTVFFQIAPIYLLCHLVTLFLYLSAVALMFWGYVDKKVAESNAEFMALILGTNLVLVIVISLVFFGQQRYLVYAFGMFYIAYYILLRKLWNIYVRGRVLGIWKKWNAKKKAE